MVPKEDGYTHINIYSKGQTELGRFLSHFSHSPIEIDGLRFLSVEGYWYWLSARDNSLCGVCGFAAKELGKRLPKVVQLEKNEFRQKIYNANWIKIHSDVNKLNSFTLSTLPFTHYYVYGGIAKPAGHDWIVEMWEIFRTTIKNNYQQA